MEQLLSYLLILAALLSAYLLDCLFNYLDRCRYQYELMKFYSSDLAKFQAKKPYKKAKQYALSIGHTPESASKEAILYIDELRRNGLINEKYRLLKKTI